MSVERNETPEWREFEKLVARIEEEAGPHGISVTSPDRILCKITGRHREVDASIRTRVGTSAVLITIECRDRSVKQDVTWIEQLATKKHAIGADLTIAVSASGFSENAKAVAHQHGIHTRKLSEVTIAELNPLLRLDVVQFWHKACSVTRVGFREFRSLDWKLPDVEQLDFTIPRDTDPFAPIFCNTQTGLRWSINDLWRQVQEVGDPFDGIQKAQPPVVLTVCFPYPGTVTVDAPDGSHLLGDVLLSAALWIEAEEISLENALKIEYGSTDTTVIQRVEFTSRKSTERSLSSQMQKASTEFGKWRFHPTEKSQKD